MKIVIVGPGAMGTLFAARLAASGAIVKSARQLHAGDSLDIKLKDGEAYCIVDKVVL